MGTKLLRSETLRSSRADFSYEKIVMLMVNTLRAARRQHGLA